MSDKTIQFWYEFASTYSYLSAMRIGALAERADVAVEWHPFWLGPIFKSQGWDSSPFNIYPVKGQYMWRDMERLCAARGLPLTRPDPFPQNTRLAARIALIIPDNAARGAFSTAVYRAEFAEGRDISDPSLLGDLLAGAGLSADLVAAAEEQPAKDALRDKVGAAMALGIFGAPSFVAGGELYWGDDRLEMALATAGD